ncbi:MAG: FAD-binding protein [Rhodospirillaceae bacterium]|nr:FAD-binding protein [Rhodospirillaceae bacterium]
MFRGRHVLLTAGGYAMNPAMFERLVSRPAFVAGSYQHSQGDGLSLATSIGGVLRGAELHRPGNGSVLETDKWPTKVYARFNTAPQSRPPWEIWVNNQGQRFVREDELQANERETALLAQPRLRYAIVFDDAIFNAAPPGIPDWTRDKMASHFNTHPMFVKADTLGELAKKAGIDGPGLQATVSAYNASIKGGSDPLGRQHRPQAIVQAPFYAIIHHGHSATSAVGVVIDKELRALRANGEPIPNLYAAGEVLGSGATLGNAFVPGMMITPAMVLGRHLGMTLPLKA